MTIFIFETYRALKEQYPKAILLIQNGDHYETFGDDAHTVADVCVSPVLCDSDDGPMVKLPKSIIQRHIARLIDAGRTVAIADSVVKVPRGAEIETIIQRPQLKADENGEVLWA